MTPSPEVNQQQPPPASKPAPSMPVAAHLACGWPLAMVAFGGAVGGGLGGAAYGVNVAIYKSSLPLPVKIILKPLTGFAAFAIWPAIAMAIQLARQ